MYIWLKIKIKIDRNSDHSGQKWDQMLAATEWRIVHWMKVLTKDWIDTQQGLKNYVSNETNTKIYYFNG